MSKSNRNFVAALALATAWVATMSAAAPLQAVPSALPLARFYPTRLASTPIGAIEDQDVWLAKVQGLMAGAPPLLQQSLLMSQTAQEFAANVALLQQMQEGSLQQSAARIQSQLQNGVATKKKPGASSNTGNTPQQ
jgi:hypothetical protein